MPRSHHDAVPVSYVAEGVWPWCRLRDDAPTSTHCALLLARTLHSAMESAGLNSRSVGAKAKLAHSTVARILNGEVLADISTLARLEAALKQPLWPGPEAVRASMHSAAEL